MAIKNQSVRKLALEEFGVSHDPFTAKYGDSGAQRGAVGQTAATLAESECPRCALRQNHQGTVLERVILSAQV